jgi:hypothetical protein
MELQEANTIRPLVIQWQLKNVPGHGLRDVGLPGPRRPGQHDLGLGTAERVEHLLEEVAFEKGVLHELTQRIAATVICDIP